MLKKGGGRWKLRGFMPSHVPGGGAGRRMAAVLPVLAVGSVTLGVVGLAEIGWCSGTGGLGYDTAGLGAGNTAPVRASNSWERNTDLPEMAANSFRCLCQVGKEP